MLNGLLKKRLAVVCCLAMLSLGCALRKQKSDVLSGESGLASPIIQAKLAAQFAKFKRAQDGILETVESQQGQMSRANWEAQLVMDPVEALTLEEQFTLSQMHIEIVAAARTAALARSTLDLNRIRAEGKQKEFCGQMPKGGMLHIHPYGTLDDGTVELILAAVNPVLGLAGLAEQLTNPGTPQGILYDPELASLRDLAEKTGPSARYLDLTSEDQRTLRELFFLPPGNHSFDRFNGVFTVISKLIFANPEVDPEPLMYRGFFARAKLQKLDYAEITTFIRPTNVWVRKLETWAKQIKDEFGVTARLLAAFNRTKPAAFTRNKVKQLLELEPSPILLGANLLADESNTPALEQGQTLYVPLLGAARSGQSKIHRTMHAGELGDVRNVRDGILMGAERLGHGVKLAEDVVTLEYARQQKLPIEINLISNLRLKVVDDLKAHPFLTFLRLGLPVSLSTDDEGIFRSTISDECVAAIDHSDITYAELKDMSLNSIKTAFVEDQEKTRLLGDLETSLLSFESNWQPFSRAPAQ